MKNKAPFHPRSFSLLNTGWIPLAVVALALAGPGRASYMDPDIEKVPTQRLIANLEKRVGGSLVENELIQPGEEVLF